MNKLELICKEKVILDANIFWTKNGNKKSRKVEMISRSSYSSDLDNILYGINGKPYLRDGGVLSISHSLSYSVMVESKTLSSIGIDIEVDRPCKYWKNIVKQFYLEPEQKICEGKNGINRFWQIWVKKEAIIKCNGGSIFDSIKQTNTFNYKKISRNDRIQILYYLLDIDNQNIHVSIAYCK